VEGIIKQEGMDLELEHLIVDLVGVGDGGNPAVMFILEATLQDIHLQQEEKQSP
jgi:hypothetical protein